MISTGLYVDHLKKEEMLASYLAENDNIRKGIVLRMTPLRRKRYLIGSCAENDNIEKDACKHAWYVFCCIFSSFSTNAS